MTAATAPRRAPVPTPDARSVGPGRPQLRVLDRAALRRRRLRRNVALAAFVAVLAGFFLVAIVHASLVASQYELDQMRSQIAELEDERARVERQIEESLAPSRIESVATLELGMVRAEAPVFLPAVRGVSDE